VVDEPTEPDAMDEASPADRLTELEVRSEFHAKTVEELDQVVREFTERLERLEREVEELKAALLGSVAARDHESSGRYSTT
jgi:uncharacterized coiled-coil protein SlyX